MNNRLAQMERLVLDLSEEIFRLKQTVSNLMADNKRIVTFYNSFKEVLSEKGVVTQDDLDAVSGLIAALEDSGESYVENGKEFGAKEKKIMN